MSNLEKDFIKNEEPIARDFLHFVNNSPTQFHAVAQAATMLKEAGFQQISERDAEWKLTPGSKYYFTRNQSSIVAFAVGEKFKPGNGFNITASHTDSPVLKVKPVSKSDQHGFQQVAIETYGGGLWHTWFDRDLSVAGRVIVNEAEGKYASKLVRINRPILRIPMLAIHLNRDIHSEGFKPNTQSHLAPILATAVKAELEGKQEGGEHHSLLTRMVADELKVKPEAIREWELCLYDTQPACLGGALNEFIFSRALDNLMMSFVSLRSLIDCTKEKADLADEEQIRMVALFDNEEIGSNSLMGAGSNYMYQTLARINGDNATMDCAMRRSFLVSADMAHALHPNYADKHEALHRPAMHKGLVIKQNANQRYATNSITSFLMNEIAKRHDIPVQKFVVRNDMGCGSTIGPILASNCGMRTIDVGIPQLAMHSIREMCATSDVQLTYELFKAFYREFHALDKQLDTSE